MKWLVTGGSGQLGIAVSRELKERGLFYISTNSKELDITLGAHVPNLIKEFANGVIVNCAAWTDVDGAEVNEDLALRVNRDGAENLAKGAKLNGAKLVHVSTDYVFSGDSNLPWQVDAEISPQSVYGRTKAEGERCVLSTYPENSSIVRTAWLYSPWGTNFAKTMTKQAINGENVVSVVNDQIGQPTSALDLAKQLVELGLSMSPPGIYHGTNSGEATWFEFAQEIFRLADADASRVVPITSLEFSRPAKRPTYSVLSHVAWEYTSVPVMRNWKIALAETMPAIISAVKANR
jgi:dTDP-4-dehydrorhamnose reductase